MLSILGYAQSLKQGLGITEIDGITTGWAGEGAAGCSAGVINNQSVISRSNFYHALMMTAGTGSWSAVINYSDTACTGPWTSFGATASITQASSPPVAVGFGYHPYIQIVVTGNAAVSYYAQNQLPILLGTGGSGSVTSVAVSMPAEFSVSGSPVTSSGTITITKANQSANQVYAGPSSGSAAAPTFRALVTADLPSSAVTSSTSAGGDLSGTYPNPGVSKVNGAAVPTSKTVLGSNSQGQFIDNSGVALTESCVGTPGNTTGAYRQQCQTSAGVIYACNNASGCTVSSDWVASGGGGGAPSGPAGGDLTGSYPNPGVGKVNGGSVPASAGCVGTNSGGQFIAGTCTANYTQSFTAQTSVTLTHNMNTLAVLVQCQDNGSPPNVIAPANIAITDVNDVTVSFTTSQSGSCTVSGTSGGFSFGLSKSGPYLTDGTHYYLPSNMFQATLPVAANFSWVNQGAATESNSGGALTLYAPPQSSGCTSIPCGSVQFRIREMSIGANSTLIAAMECTQHWWPFNSCGIGFYESATGKLETIDIGANNDAVLSNAIGVNQYNSVTSFNATKSGTGAIFPDLLLFKIVKTGGNISFYWSNDGGYSWLDMWTEAQNAFFTTAPDEWFYFNDNEFGGPIAGKTVDSWATLLSWSTQ